MKTNMNFNLFTPTKLLFGCGKLNELGNQSMPGKKALLLISNGQSVRTTGTLDRTVAQLDKANAAHVLCANIHENPSKEVVMEAAAVARENGCDFIVALGGGAVLDSAVAVAAMATNPGDLWDYVHGGTGKGLPLQQPGLPIVTIFSTFPCALRQRGAPVLVFSGPPLDPTMRWTIPTWFLSSVVPFVNFTRKPLLSFPWPVSCFMLPLFRTLPLK